jgi:hypothetical protein
MVDSTSFNPLLAPGITIAAAAKSSREESRAKRACGFFAWIGLLAAGVGAVAPLSHFTLQEAQTLMLLQADDAAAAQALEQDWSDSASPDYVETLSELGLQIPVVDAGSAYVAAKLTTQLDPSRASAWATLAYLETKRAAGKVNQASLDALTKSMDACPLCSEDLIAWRLNFVLSNWAAVPEPLRRRAFEHADLLRWIGSNAELMAEMRIKARQNGIPFDAYRAAVNTPARTWDIGPSPQATATKGARPI